MEKERRVLTTGPLEIRQQEDGEGQVLAGMAPPWESWSRDLGGFRERFDRDAFTNLDDPDFVVQCTVGHRDSELLGTTPNTLRFRSEDEGLRYEVDIPDTEVGRAAVEHTRRQDYRGSSFEFSVESDTWDTTKEPAERVVHSARLFAVNPVVNPAYADTSVAMRELRELQEERSEEAEERHPGGKPESREESAVERVRALDLEPGDGLVVTLKRSMDSEDVERMREDIVKQLGERPVLIVGPDADVAVARSKDEPREPGLPVRKARQALRERDV